MKEKSKDTMLLILALLISAFFTVSITLLAVSNLNLKKENAVLNEQLNNTNSTLMKQYLFGVSDGTAYIMQKITQNGTIPLYDVDKNIHWVEITQLCESIKV